MTISEKQYRACPECNGTMERFVFQAKKTTGTRARKGGGWAYTKQNVGKPQVKWICHNSFDHTITEE